jgi:hypothetical protein
MTFDQDSGESMEDTEEVFNHLLAGAIKTFKSRSTFESREEFTRD